jgi:uncharacterized membrane protein
VPVTSPAPAAQDSPAPLPSWSDRVAASAAAGLGGVWGRHAGVSRRGWWTPVRVLLLLTMLPLLLGFAQKSPCADGNWSGSKQYTHFCYSDIVPLWSDERLDVGGVPYRDTAVEYPVLTGGFMWLSADITRLLHGVITSWSQLLLFGVVSAALLAICGLLVTYWTAAAAGRRPYDAALFALSPLLVFHAYSNWDLLAMAFTSGALWAWARNRPVLAGAMIGLGTAAKLYPALLLVALVVLAIRSRRYREVAWTVVAAIGTWLAVNLPVALAYYDGWREFYAFSFDRPTERSTLWAVGKTLADAGADASDAVYWVPPGIAVALLLAASLLLIAWLGLRAPVRPRVAQLAFLAVLAFLLTTKVWSPQYSLWLVPLLALARPRWRLAMVWQFTEIAVWMLTLTLLLGLDPSQSAHGVSYGWLAAVLLARDGMLLALAGLIVYEMWHPERDAVRAGGDPEADPGAGPFAVAAEPSGLAFSAAVAHTGS